MCHALLGAGHIRTLGQGQRCGGRAKDHVAAHTGGHEHHIGAFQQLGDTLTVFHGGLPADVRVGAGAQALGDLAAELNHGFRGGVAQRLGVRVGADEIHAFHVGTHHMIDGVATAATDAHYFDHRAMGYGIFEFELHG